MFPDKTKQFSEKGVCGKQQNLEWRRVQGNENSSGVYTIGFEESWDVMTIFWVLKNFGI